MDKNIGILYNEYPVSIFDMKFIFFTDDGFSIRGAYHSENHYHEFNEILYCFNGSLKITSANTVENITAGDVVLIPEKAVHSINTSAEAHCMFLPFWKNNIQQMPEDIKVLKHFIASNAFDRIVKYYYENYRYKKDFMLSCFHEIAAALAEIFNSNNINGQDTVTLENNNYRKYIIQQYFLLNYNNSPKISELAGLLHLSVQQTQRIIQKLYSRTFREQVLFLRIDKAKYMLKNTDVTIAKIAETVGYNNSNNFHSAFKTYSGITPNEYRKKYSC